MIIRLASLVFGLTLTGAVSAHDYPTTDRVEFVLECMRNNGGDYQYLYKCSCAIDAIAKDMAYDNYVESAAIVRYQGMGGERAGVFRDPEGMKDAAKRYRTVRADAFKQCGIDKKP